MTEKKKGLTYADAGVNIDAGNRAVELMKDSVRATFTKGVIGDVGGFGGLYSLSEYMSEDPVLVSGTDGVGTKLRLAIELGMHGTIGQDCVAMSVNDILVQGACPLFFLDYIASGQLDPEQTAQVVRGVAEACRESGCALLGGETAEMAGFYAPGDYDLAGFAVGIADRRHLITGADICAGDVILGLPSSGVHSNGYSLVRRILADRHLDLHQEYDSMGRTLGEVLLTPTKLYPRVILPLFGQCRIKGMVHITGGGFYENIPRVLPQGTAAELDGDAWDIPSVFPFLMKEGGVEAHEMYRTFNCGIGMILILSEKDGADCEAFLRSRGESVFSIGRIVDGERTVSIKGGLFHGA